MSLLIGFLTFILVVICVFLNLLVLVQLPKKEAGAGLAFGAGAVDTLIGAGSGNALTKITKVLAGLFLGLAVVLAMLNSQYQRGASRSLQEELTRQPSAAPVLPVQPATTPAAGALSNNPVPAAPAGQQGAAPVNLTPILQTPAAATPNVSTSAPAPAPASTTQPAQP